MSDEMNNVPDDDIRIMMAIFFPPQNIIICGSVIIISCSIITIISVAWIVLHHPFLDILSYHSHRSVTINNQQWNNAAPGAPTTSRVADSKETQPSWVTWPGRLLSYSLFICRWCEEAVLTQNCVNQRVCDVGWTGRYAGLENSLKYWEHFLYRQQKLM